MELRAWLLAHGWQTRQQMGEGLGWNERKIRAVGEAMGTEVVRGQQGYTLLDKVPTEELHKVKHAAAAILSQAHKNEAYGLGLLRAVAERQPDAVQTVMEALVS